MSHESWTNLSDGNQHERPDADYWAEKMYEKMMKVRTFSYYLEENNWNELFSDQDSIILALEGTFGGGSGDTYITKESGSREGWITLHKDDRENIKQKISDLLLPRRDLPIEEAEINEGDILKRLDFSLVGPDGQHTYYTQDLRF